MFRNAELTRETELAVHVHGGIAVLEDGIARLSIHVQLVSEVEFRIPSRCSRGLNTDSLNHYIKQHAVSTSNRERA